MKEIELTNGYKALVDDSDFEFLNKWKWKVATKDNITYYSVRSTYEDGKQKLILMHRFLLQINDRKIYVDHKDHNGLNNQKDNLRPGTPGQNAANRTSHQNTSSRYLGVCFRKDNKKWRSSICKNGKIKSIGQFDSEIDAAIAYNKEAMQMHGEFAHLNVIS